jgi:ABC-type proline/glycine betaine transport system permease subunit
VTAAAIIAITLLIYPIYIIVAEDIGPFAALKKGVSAAKENFWKTLGLFALLLVISLLISLVIGFIVGLITVPFGPNISQVVIAIVNAAVQSYIPIVMMIAFMSFYLALAGSKPGAEETGSGDVIGTI